MYIASIHIKNFKCLKEVTFEFDPHFNVIIGGNNSGKSTVMEALRLWQLAFNKFLKDRTNSQESSFRSNQFFSFTIDDLLFLRINDFKKLFYPNSKTIEVKLTIKNEEDKEIDLPIFFTLTTEKLNLRFELCKDTNTRKKASESLLEILKRTKGSTLKDVMLITYINPIFHLPIKEPLFSRGYIIDKLHQARVSEVIRNLIHIYAPFDYQTKAKQEPKQELKEIERTLHYIVNNEIIIDESSPFLTFYSNLKQDEDAHIELLAYNRENNAKVEISQLGSGTINLLNILSVLAYGDYSNFALNILLLDEPDSHLHANHQKRLFEYLLKTAKDNNKQMFIITHNHELIECSENVLYIDKSKLKNKSTIKSIPKSEYYKIYKDIAVDYHKKMIELVTKIEIENKLKKITKPTLFCEGSTDVTILISAFNMLYQKDSFFDNILDIEDGNSDSGVTNKLIYNTITSTTLLGVLDCDYAGIKSFNSLLKDGKGFEVGINSLHHKREKQNNSHCLLLPIPIHRKEKADWFDKNTCIEYIFSDESLLKMGVELETKRGNTYQTIKDIDNSKAIIQKNLFKLGKEDYLSFKPLFETIATIINYTLPE